MFNRLLAVGVVAAVLCTGAAADSIYIAGIHYWSPGADRDIMAWHTGWDVEANLASDTPDLQMYNDICGEGFTIIQRLDWRWEQTVPDDPADYAEFAAQCANFASQIKDYCHIYLIGNEVELYGVGQSEYATMFQQVRSAIKSVQPEAWVNIGHWCHSDAPGKIALMLGPDGYDGFTAHSNSVPENMLADLNSVGAAPHAGVYTTEFGWVMGTNPHPEEEFYNIFTATDEWNASHFRQEFAKCFFVYMAAGWEHASLKIWPNENAGYEWALVHANPKNKYANDQIQVSNLSIHVDSETQVTVTWDTDRPSTTQVWYGQQEATGGYSTQRDPTLRTEHTAVITGLSPYESYYLVARSTAMACGDAADGPHPFATGMSTATVPYKIQNGWNLVSVPLQPADPEASAVFADLVGAGNVLANNLSRYRAGMGYELYPGDFTELAPGEGYWLYLTNAVENTTYGQKIWDPVTVPLQQGWNLVGHPSTISVRWYDDVQVTDGTYTKSVEDAAAAGWIQGTAYYYDGVYKTLGQQYVADDYKLRRWRGYWVLANQPDLQLIIPTH